MDRSAIILAGGINSESVSKLEDKPLLNYVIDAVKELVDEVIVVVDSKECAEAYAKIISPRVKLAVMQGEFYGNLAEALTGFEVAQGEYSLILPAGSPFVSQELVSLLFELCFGKAAVVPRWTNQEVEPLHAVYNTKQALETSKVVLSEGKSDMESLVEKLRGVRYLSTMVIEQIDPDFKSFFTATTPADMRKASVMSKPKPLKKGRKRNGRY